MYLSLQTKPKGDHGVQSTYLMFSLFSFAKKEKRLNAKKVLKFQSPGSLEFIVTAKRLKEKCDCTEVFVIIGQ